MSRKIFFLVLCLFALTATGQTARKFTVNITPDGKSNMVAYLPENPTGRAVVDCPGGGYSRLSMENEGHSWAAYFNDKGIAFFVLTYRMPQGDRTIPVSDAENAIRMVRDSASAWGVNPGDVGIMGFSAGGHLASTVCTHAPFEARPDFSILFYPVISMVERDSHSGSVNNFLGSDKNNKKLVHDFSNNNAVRRHLTPPAIILLANDDRAVPPVTNGVAYYSAMRRAGNPCAMHIYTSGGHGFGFRESFKYHDEMLADLTRWLETLPSPRPDAVKVACIGNSITDGMGIDMASQLGYPAQLQQLLGSNYRVKNYGVSARTMLNKGDFPYMNEPAWQDAQAFRPDIAVIKLGTNDSKGYNWKHKEDFEADYQQMIDALKPATILLCTPIKAFEDKWEITDSVIVNEVIPAIRRVAKRNKLDIIDLHAVITDKAMMTRDNIHPNDKGARQMAEAVAAKIKEIRKNK